MVRLVNIFHTSSLITVQNLVAVSHTVCAHVGRCQNVGDAGAPPLRIGAWLKAYRNTLLPCVTMPNLVILGQTIQA